MKKSAPEEANTHFIRAPGTVRTAGSRLNRIERTGQESTSLHQTDSLHTFRRSNSRESLSGARMSATWLGVWMVMCGLAAVESTDLSRRSLRGAGHQLAMSAENEAVEFITQSLLPGALARNQGECNFRSENSDVKGCVRGSQFGKHPFVRACSVEWSKFLQPMVSSSEGVPETSLHAGHAGDELGTYSSLRILTPVTANISSPVLPPHSLGDHSSTVMVLKQVAAKYDEGKSSKLRRDIFEKWMALDQNQKEFHQNIISYLDQD